MGEGKGNESSLFAIEGGVGGEKSVGGARAHLRRLHDVRLDELGHAEVSKTRALRAVSPDAGRRRGDVRLPARRRVHRATRV